MPGTAFCIGFCFSSPRATAPRRMAEIGRGRGRGVPRNYFRDSPALPCLKLNLRECPSTVSQPHRKLKITSREKHTRLHHCGAENRLNNGYDVRKLRKTLDYKKQRLDVHRAKSRLPNASLDCLKTTKYYRTSECPGQRKLEFFRPYQLGFTCPRANLSSTALLPWDLKQIVGVLYLSVCLSIKWAIVTVHPMLLRNECINKNRGPGTSRMLLVSH